MTLAEVMLIILFALLLLLGRQYLDLDKARKTLQNYSAVISTGWSQNMSQAEVDTLTGLIEETKKRQKPDEEISETWETLTSNLEEDRNKPDEESDATELLNRLEAVREETKKAKEEKEEAEKVADAAQEELRKANELLNRLEAVKEEAKKAKEEKEEAEKVADAAQRELRKAKAGSPPPCIFEPGTGEKIKGSSVALGAIYINEELIELVDINRKLLSLNAVDFIGRRVDYDTKVYDLISSWPEDEPLTFEEFSSLAQPIVEIGNIDSDLKLKCMFTMNYYDEAGTSYDTIRLRFLRYFLSQRKLSQNELSNFRRN